MQPIVPPEDLAAEQDFRWRPSGRDSAAARATGGRTSRRRGNRQSSAADAGAAAAGSRKRRARRDRDLEPEWEERDEFVRRRGGRRVAGGPSGSGGRADAAAIGQLRRKQRQLADREHKCETDLHKVSNCLHRNVEWSQGG